MADEFTTSRVALVVNTRSRTGLEAFERAGDLLRSLFGEVAATAVHSGDDLLPALDRALLSKPDLLVVGGGDGTIGAAAHRIANSRVALGVLPLGTANDFARTLEIPTEVQAAVDNLVHGKVVDVDLGQVDGATYLNVASVGLSVAVTRHLSPGLKKRLGPLAYPAAAAMAYRDHRPFSARLEFPDGDHEPLELDDLLQVAVGNGRHYGGGMTVAPSASLDDHLLDVYAIERGRLRDHISIAALFKNGRFIEHERVTHLTTRHVRLVTDPALPINVDGEISHSTPAEFTMLRNALLVIVPQSSRAARLDPRTG